MSVPQTASNRQDTLLEPLSSGQVLFALLEMKADVVTVRTQVASLTTDLTELKARMTRYEADMAEVKADLAEIKVEMAHAIKVTLDAIKWMGGVTFKVLFGLFASALTLALFAWVGTQLATLFG